MDTSSFRVEQTNKTDNSKPRGGPSQTGKGLAFGPDGASSSLDAFRSSVTLVRYPNPSAPKLWA